VCIFICFGGQELGTHIGFDYRYPDVNFVHLEDNYMKYLLCKSAISV
jgi:uncharacterized protein (DUF1919 family)